MFKEVEKILILLLLFFLFFAGIIRHDKDKSEYIRLANEPQFDNVGLVFFNDSFKGTCVLVHKKYALSCAHIFVHSDFELDTLNDNDVMAVTYAPKNKRLIEAKNITISLKAKKVEAKKIIFFPGYDFERNNYDIAIIELTDYIEDIEPAKINKEFDEYGAKVVGVGYGAFGVANKPEEIDTSHIKIAGGNTIDAFDGDPLFGEQIYMLCDFDHPTDPTCNRMGNEVPLDLEYIVTGGDSGSPLFRFKNGVWELVGICSGSPIEIEQFLKTGYYGQIMRWVRVSVFASWIEENLK